MPVYYVSYSSYHAEFTCIGFMTCTSSPAGKAVVGISKLACYSHKGISAVIYHSCKVFYYHSFIVEYWKQRYVFVSRFAVSISDEPFIHHEETYTKLVDRVHRTSPDVRCIEAVETEYLGDLDIYVPKLSHLNLWYPKFIQKRRQGAELWFYTCCHPLGKYPNRFLDQSLLKVRILHWINYLYDLDGYLHWGLNHYGTDDPYSQAGISKDLPLGDRAIVYPGSDSLLGSLRFSAQRDGLEDFEYLWVLADRIRSIKEKVGDDGSVVNRVQRRL